MVLLKHLVFMFFVGYLAGYFVAFLLNRISRKGDF